jgi:hypothetical protein
MRRVSLYIGKALLRKQDKPVLLSTLSYLMSALRRHTIVIAIVPSLRMHRLSAIDTVHDYPFILSR